MRRANSYTLYSGIILREREEFWEARQRLFPYSSFSKTGDWAAALCPLDMLTRQVERPYSCNNTLFYNLTT